MKKIVASVGIGIVLVLLYGHFSSPALSAGPAIKLGLLLPLSGPANAYGPTTVNAAKLAVGEINEAGGVNGRQLELLIGDTATDPKIANEQAKVMLVKNKVDALFIQATSAERNAIVPVVEKEDILFFYNVLYEGTARSKNLFIDGETPHQQVVPIIPYVMKEFKLSNWYIIAADYVWPWELNKVFVDTVQKANGKIVGQDYVPIGTSEFSSIIAKIQSLKPEGISAEIWGPDAIAFMKQLNAAGLGKSVKVVFYAVDENVLGAMGETGVGALEATAYFYDLPSKQNKQFLEKYFNKFGSSAQKPNFMAVPTYDAIHLWELAAKKAKSIETRKVRDQICNVTFQSPRGSIKYDPDSQHAKLPIYIGEGQADGRFKVIKDLGVISPMGK